MGNSDSHASIKVLYANYTAIKSINDLSIYIIIMQDMERVE